MINSFYGFVLYRQLIWKCTKSAVKVLEMFSCSCISWLQGFSLHFIRQYFPRKIIIPLQQQHTSMRLYWL